MFITNSTALKRIVVVSTLYVLKKEDTLLSQWLESKFLIFIKHDFGLIIYGSHLDRQEIEKEIIIVFFLSHFRVRYKNTLFIFLSTGNVKICLT